MTLSYDITFKPSPRFINIEVASLRKLVINLFLMILGLGISGCWKNIKLNINTKL